MKKCIVLFSGGLDSRLVVKLMQEKGFEILAVYFKLPFSCSKDEDVKDFCKQQKIKLKIFDVTKGKLFKEYLKTIKQAEHGTGAGMNPCIDCKIFMFKKTKEFADKESRLGSPKTLNAGCKINLIATGEVVGQRPMSQMENSMKLIESKANLEDKIIRPLIDLGISGRQRKKQIALAKKFKINYPSPAGGCLLCEKQLKNRFKTLFKRELNEKEIKLISIGRHFIINNSWIILGRNEKENKIIEKMKIGRIIIPDFIGATGIILDEPNKEIIKRPSEKVIKKVGELIKAYSKKGNLKDRKKFEEFKL